MPLNPDMLLAILDILDISDVLAMRQVCKALRDLTYERPVWAWRYAQMLRERSIAAPIIDSRLSTAYMESALRKNRLFQSAWLRARPNLESIRLCTTLTTPEHAPFLGSSLTMIAPGGGDLLLFNETGAYILSLEDPSATPAQFLNLEDADVGGQIIGNWIASRQDDGSLAFFAAIGDLSRDPSLPPRTYAVWSADFRISPVVPRYEGQFTTLGRPSITRVMNELFMYHRDHTEDVFIFDWRALLGGGHFRSFAFRFQSESQTTRYPSDICLASNNYILVVEDKSSRLHVFAPPQFETVAHLVQPLPMEYATPLWRYDAEQMGFRGRPPLTVFPLPSSESLADSDESCILLVAPYRRTYGRAILGPDGMRFFGLVDLQASSTFIYSQTKALIIHLFSDGCYVNCYSYAANLDKNGPTLRSHGTFRLHTYDVPNLAHPHRPRDRFQDEYFRVYFDEESGRICFFMTNPAFSNFPEYDIVIVDFV